MAWSADTRLAVRQAYVFDRQSMEAAALSHGVPPATAKRWKADAKADGDDWDQARAAHRLSSGNQGLLIQALLEDYTHLHQATQTALRGAVNQDPLKAAEALSRLADAFTKVMSAVGKASPEVSRLALLADFVRALITFVSERYPDHQEAFAEVLEPFGQHLSRKYSK